MTDVAAGHLTSLRAGALLLSLSLSIYLVMCGAQRNKKELLSQPLLQTYLDLEQWRCLWEVSCHVRLALYNVPA